MTLRRWSALTRPITAAVMAGASACFLPACGDGQAPGADDAAGGTGAMLGTGGGALGTGGTTTSTGGTSGASGGAEFGTGSTSSGGASGDGGVPASGAAPSTGGSPGTGASSSTGGTNTGGAGADGTGGGHGGSDGSGAAAGSGGSGMANGPLFPASGSTDVCPDPSLRIRFDGPPTLGAGGTVRVFDTASPSAPVATISMANAQISDTVGGATFQLPRPAYVHGNEAIFLLPSVGLTYGHTYGVTVDAEVVSGPGGPTLPITDPAQWQFTVASSAPTDRGTLRVALDGQGQFCSLQGAINASMTGSSISLGPGAYYGITYFKNKNGLSIVGDDRATTLIAGVNNNNLNPSTRGRALFGAESLSGLTIEQLTIENQTPQGGSQAEALALLSCDQCIIRDSTIRSLQDTLLWSGRLYAEQCLIEGNVDYIWGTGTVYFNQCEIKTVGRSGYNLQARNGTGTYGYVFVDSKLSADLGISGDVLARIDVSQYPASHVAYINCEMGSHISPAGWTITGGGSTSSLRFWEYQSTTPQGTPVNTSSRAAGSRQLSATEAAQMRDPKIVLAGWDPTL